MLATPPHALGGIPLALPRRLGRGARNVDALLVGVALLAAARVLLARPERRQDNLLEAGFHGALVEPGVHAGLDELGDLGHVLQARAAADEGAYGEIEAVVVEEGECEGGRAARGAALGAGGRAVGGARALGIVWGGRARGCGWGRGRGDEGDGEGAGEADDADGQGDGQHGDAVGGPVEHQRRLDAQGDDVGEVDVHAGLQAALLGARQACAGAAREEALLGGHDAAVAEDGELVAEGDLGDLDLAQEGGLGARVEHLGQAREHGAVLAGIGAQLGNGLGDEHVEPVEALWLVALDIVIRLGEDGGDAGPARAGGLADDGAARLVTERVGGAVGARPLVERPKGRLVGEGAGAAQAAEVHGAVVGRGQLAEDEELDEDEDDERDGELAQEEALREGEAGVVSTQTAPLEGQGRVGGLVRTSSPGMRAVGGARVAPPCSRLVNWRVCSYIFIAWSCAIQRETAAVNSMLE